ncbi:hypothetical protein MUK42_14745 [Musa troglodytarum]|uniref:AtTam37 zinc finger domain-containing protein n=1 Tax=Musa troglodytarum TaxID=320322 RepID=A0A9E7L9Q8_9LILI|nr:hypothetical protein MUK42_14745 [Musa troglodytarum]
MEGERLVVKCAEEEENAKANFKYKTRLKGRGQGTSILSSSKQKEGEDRACRQRWERRATAAGVVSDGGDGGGGGAARRAAATASGERATADCVAEAIFENRAELVHLPAAINRSLPLPSKDCPTCDGTGVMGCPECKHKWQVRISADNIMEPPWKAYNVMRKMDYPYENIVHSMRDPKIAAFWLITMPQILGGFNYDEDVKQKIWWSYEESIRYDQLRDLVAERKPGWEHLQNALISVDPVRARDDPVIVKNIPYYKAKKALEAEVLNLDVPPRPQNWGLLHFNSSNLSMEFCFCFFVILYNAGMLVEVALVYLIANDEIDLPLKASSWTEEELKDPAKVLEMTSLLTAQREIADKILDAQWEAKWRQDKLNDLLKEKLQPYLRSVDKAGLPQSIVMRSDENKKTAAASA